MTQPRLSNSSVNAGHNNFMRNAAVADRITENIQYAKQNTESLMVI